jgi:hypothetical protein
VIADKGYDADSVRSLIREHGALPNIPNRANRKRKYRWTKAIYRQRNLVERFFNKLKQFRHIATRYDKLGATFFAFIQLASIRIFLRSIESTPSSRRRSQAKRASGNSAGTQATATSQVRFMGGPAACSDGRMVPTGQARG